VHDPYDGQPSVTARHGVPDLFSLSSEYCVNTFLDLNNVWTLGIHSHEKPAPPANTFSSELLLNPPLTQNLLLHTTSAPHPSENVINVRIQMYGTVKFPIRSIPSNDEERLR
jgi:hypothetical protein